ncbi:MAG: hypothetical protein ACRC67_44095 [Inquilinus sp.]|uniref:hypothetical protein n=1 Tax=Inquilinus sp. TaxID=1932117 RepID=UPI003F3699F1
MTHPDAAETDSGHDQVLAEPSRWNHACPPAAFRFDSRPKRLSGRIKKIFLEIVRSSALGGRPPDTVAAGERQCFDQRLEFMPAAWRSLTSAGSSLGNSALGKTQERSRMMLRPLGYIVRLPGDSNKSAIGTESYIFRLRLTIDFHKKDGKRTYKISQYFS